MAQPSQAATNPHQNEEDVVPVPQVGDWAPTLGETVQFPREKPVVVVFLRHCGCPCKFLSSRFVDSEQLLCLT